MKRLAVAFDTSNYTTSCAEFDGETGENRGRLLDVPEGALGLRQSEALFLHIKRISGVFNELTLSGEICAVGASVTPRETKDSYMPCFLAGKSHAHVLARAFGVPSYEFSHQQGHIAAAAWSAGKMDVLDKPMLCWHLSGGTTELLYVRPNGCSVTCEIIGGTDDISAGQLIDRAGNLIGLRFPSGRELDTLAVSVNTGEKYIPKLLGEGFRFSLSGVEHKMKAMAAEKTPGETAFFTFWAITSVIKRVTELALSKYGLLPVLFSGGVASSAFLRREISGGLFCEPEFSADNAMGVAILTYRAVMADGK